jgi:hydroxyacylglutathione hydrolase
MKITCMPSGPLGVNTYLVIDEAAKEGFIVDPGGYNPKLTKKVSDEGAEIKYIILTHGHADHISGVNEHLDDFPNAKVVAHANEKSMLEDSKMNQSLMFGSPQVVKADILVNDGDELEVGNLKLKFLFTPGHTPGGMCIYIDTENVLFSGDTLFRQSIGRTDFPGGSFKDLADAVHTKLFILPDETLVLPGHMGQTSIGFEKGNNPFV